MITISRPKSAVLGSGHLTADRYCGGLLAAAHRPGSAAAVLEHLAALVAPVWPRQSFLWKLASRAVEFSHAVAKH